MEGIRDIAEIQSGIPCQDCGCRVVFLTARATRSVPRCCQCGRTRRDLAASVCLPIGLSRIAHAEATAAETRFSAGTEDSYLSADLPAAFSRL
jgi:hypothetical protein